MKYVKNEEINFLGLQ